MLKSVRVKNPDAITLRDCFGATALSTVNGLCTVFMSSMFMQYMTDYAGLGAMGATLATSLLLFARIFDAVDDPIQGFLGADVDMHRANEIRPVMKHIAELAEKYKCAIILIGHMNKCSMGKSAYRGLGSIDFQAAARSVLIVGRIKDEPEIRVVCQTKSSLAPEAKSIAFRLSEENGFEWIGEYDVTADDLLSGTAKGAKKQAAIEFLENTLADGQTAQTELMELAKQKGISEKTLRNAKEELGVKSKRVNNQWYWSLN